MAQRFDNVKLEKGMYHEAGRSFTQVLEKLDPSEQYRGTAMEGLDAYQRQLKRFDIRVKGAGSDLVDKFFSTSQSAVLFPEYIARAVKVGMEEANILPDITATETLIEGMDYRSITSAPEDEKQLKQVAEGAAIPQTTVRTRDSLVKLHKRGRMLVASYEAIRFQKLDLFSVTLRQIGAQIGRMHLEDAINVIVNGDGNGNPAQASAVETAGTLAYKDLLASGTASSPTSSTPCWWAPTPCPCCWPCGRCRTPPPDWTSTALAGSSPPWGPRCCAPPPCPWARSSAWTKITPWRWSRRAT